MKIGETFSCNGKTYVAEPAVDSCSGCAFNVDGCTVSNVCKAEWVDAPSCVPNRFGGDDVVFKEVKAV